MHVTDNVRPGVPIDDFSMNEVGGSQADKDRRRGLKVGDVLTLDVTAKNSHRFSAASYSTVMSVILPCCYFKWEYAVGNPVLNQHEARKGLALIAHNAN